MTKHSQYGASGAHRWCACYGSVKLCENIPSRSSVYASEGTKAHELAEMVLLGKPIPQDTDLEMYKHVMVYYDYIKLLGGVLEVEKRFHLNFIDPRMFGTCDAVVINDRKIEIIDLKYGAGVMVSPENNMQLEYYALGALYNEALDDIDYGFEEIKLTIVQPRCDDPIKSWVVTYKELHDFVIKMKEAIRLSELPNPPFAMGDHCRWCPAVISCPRVKEMHNTVAVSVFEKMDIVDKHEFVRKVIEKKGIINKIIDECEEYALEYINSGGTINGLVLKEGRKSRTWKEGSEASLIKIFGEDIYEREIKSPAKLEKTCNKEIRQTVLNSLIITQPGKIKVVPENSKGVLNE